MVNTKILQTLKGSSKIPCNHLHLCTFIIICIYENEVSIYLKEVVMPASQEKYTKIFKATFSLLDKNFAFNLIIFLMMLSPKGLLYNTGDE